MVHQTLSILRHFIPKTFSFTEKATLVGLLSDNNLWSEASDKTRKKYRKLAKQVAKEDELTQHLKASFSENVEKLDKELNNWLRGMTVNRENSEVQIRESFGSLFFLPKIAIAFGNRLSFQATGAKKGKAPKAFSLSDNCLYRHLWMYKQLSHSE